ncbi:MAG: PTS sugar transporter subunit IIC [Desulfuromonadales bacterium]|jgi:PTS system mannose-specific IIC component
MLAADYFLAGAVSLVAGLDRTAAFQFMLSRPIVAAPLTGWVLGAPATGMQVGILIELLWLGRLPIGAAIPPDDTQVAVGATALAIGLGSFLGLAGVPFTLLAVFTALPIGKIGQVFERLVRQRNVRLTQRAELALAEGRLRGIEAEHLWGLSHFALASLATYSVIVGAGSIILYFLAPLLIEPVSEVAGWFRLLFVLIGTAVILATMNVSRAMSLFGASFATAFLMLWLL